MYRRGPTISYVYKDSYELCNRPATKPSVPANPKTGIRTTAVVPVPDGKSGGTASKAAPSHHAHNLPCYAYTVPKYPSVLDYGRVGQKTTVVQKPPQVCAHKAAAKAAPPTRNATNLRTGTQTIAVAKPPSPSRANPYLTHARVAAARPHAGLASRYQGPAAVAAHVPPPLHRLAANPPASLKTGTQTVTISKPAPPQIAPSQGKSRNAIQKSPTVVTPAVSSLGTAAKIAPHVSTLPKVPAKAMYPPAVSKQQLTNPKVGTQTTAVQRPAPPQTKSRNDAVPKSSTQAHVAKPVPVPVPASNKTGTATTAVALHAPSYAKYVAGRVPPLRTAQNVVTHAGGAATYRQPVSHRIGTQTIAVARAPQPGRAYMPSPAHATQHRLAPAIAKPSLLAHAAGVRGPITTAVRPPPAKATATTKANPKPPTAALAHPQPSAKLSRQTTAVPRPAPIAALSPPRRDPAEVPHPAAMLDFIPQCMLGFYVPADSSWNDRKFLAFQSYKNMQVLVKCSDAKVFELVVGPKSTQFIVKMREGMCTESEVVNSYEEYMAFKTMSDKGSEHYPRVLRYVWSLVKGRVRSELVMEHCGESLHQKNRPQSTYTISDMLCFIYQCAVALNEPILKFHGDIKPANICEKDKMIRLIDLGHAFINCQKDECSVTQYTKGYAAPEIVDAISRIRKGETVYLKESKLSDVYSLGVSFLELACKKTKDDMEKYLEKVAANPKFAYNFEFNKIQLPGSPAEEALLKELLRKMLRPSLSDRIELTELIKKTGAYLVDKTGTVAPAFWDPQWKPVEVKEVHVSNEEFKRVADLFCETMPRTRIVRLQRIQNPELWENFAFKRRKMAKASGKDPLSLRLFHGTRTTEPAAIFEGTDGFDMRHCKTGYWGIGNYFAVNAKYSDAYAYKATAGTKQMLLADVLVGDFCFVDKKNPDLRMPPAKSGTNVKYDSVKANTDGSDIYVTYNNLQAYPQYLITYV